MNDELSPDMIWRTCLKCRRQFTLADMDESGDCPWCGYARSEPFGGTEI